VSNAGSFHFVLMPVHKNKNGEVSIKPRRRDFLFTRCNAPPSPKIALGHGKTQHQEGTSTKRSLAGSTYNGFLSHCFSVENGAN